MQHKMNKKGFTIVELLIAISVFSLSIMLVTAVVLGIARQYQKASYTVQLNDASRNIHESIARDINYGASITAVQGTTIKYFCSEGRVMYAWKPTSGASINNGLFRYDLNSGGVFVACNDATASTALANGVNLLPRNGFVANFSSNSVGGGVSEIITNFKVGTADMFEDSTNPAGSNCLPTLRGGDFCSVVEYNSVVKPRI